MSKIAALQFPTLALSESRLDYYLNIKFGDALKQGDFQ